MAQVELSLKNVHKHGLPQACLCCSSEEEPQRTELSYGSAPISWKTIGCLFFLGPSVWVIAFIVYLFKKVRGRHSSGGPRTLPVPICRSCEKAKFTINTRNLVLFATSSLLTTWFFFRPLTASLNPTFTIEIAAALALGVYAFVDYFCLIGQFTPKVVKYNEERVVLELPNDEYPSLYQRYLDTVKLYGSVHKTGTAEEHSRPPI